MQQSCTFPKKFVMLIPLRALWYYPTFEASLIVTDYWCPAVHVTIFFLPHSRCFAFSFYLLDSQGRIEWHEIDRESKKRDKTKKLKNYMNCRTQKSGTNSLASVWLPWSESPVSRQWGRGRQNSSCFQGRLGWICFKQ